MTRVDALDMDAHESAETSVVQIAREILDVTSDALLDLELPWNTARGLFAQAVFERARRRYGTMPQVASALDTALRTVRRYASASRRRALPSGPTYNMRARVLRALAGGPMSLAQLEHRFPRASDVNYARGALRSLVREGAVVHDPTSDTFARSEAGGTDDGHTRRRLELVLRLLGAEAPDEVRSLLAGFEDLAGPRLERCRDELAALLGAFAARWSSDDAAEPTPACNRRPMLTLSAAGMDA